MIKRTKEFIITNRDKCPERNRVPLRAQRLMSDSLGLNFGVCPRAGTRVRPVRHWPQAQNLSSPKLGD